MASVTPAMAQAPVTATPPPATLPSTAAVVFPAPVTTSPALFELRPSVRLTEDYSSNFDRTSEGARDNLRTSLSPGLGLLVNGALTKGQVAYTLAATHDAATGDAHLFHAFAGKVAWQASPRLAITVSDTFSRTDEPAEADRLSLRRERREFTSNTFTVSADYRIAEIETREYYTLSTFLGDADTIAHSVGATASTRLGPTTAGTIGAEYSTSATSDGSEASGPRLSASVTRRLNAFTSAGVAASYALRTVAGGAGASEFHVWNLSLFNAYVAGPWSVTGSLGVVRLLSDAGDDSTMASTATTVAYRFAQATASVGIEQGFSETFFEGENFGVVETRGVSATLGVPLTPSVGANVRAFYRQNDFTGIGGGPAGESSDTTGGTVSLRVRVTRWLDLALEYGYTRQMATRTEGPISEHGLRASIGTTF